MKTIDEFLAEPTKALLRHKIALDRPTVEYLREIIEELIRWGERVPDQFILTQEQFDHLRGEINANRRFLAGTVDGDRWTKYTIVMRDRMVDVVVGT